MARCLWFGRLSKGTDDQMSVLWQESTDDQVSVVWRAV